jgi:hypothetical protein
MDDPPLNPAQHVERIREILIGRQMHQVEDRLRTLEKTVGSQGTQIGSEVVARVQRSQSAVLEETRELRHQLRQESQLRSEQIERLGRQLESTCRNLSHHDQHLQQSLSTHLDNISTAMAARIDARVREILQHLQTEIVQWKNQIDRDMQGLRNVAVTRTEVKTRFARLASAAMEDDPLPDDGFLP